jgi:hypothetical protein
MRLSVVLQAFVAMGVSGLLSVACSSGEGGGDSTGCSSDQECKGDRICVDGACVTPDAQGGGGGWDSGSAGKSGGSSGGTSGAEPQGCTITSNDCDPDCQASCGTPSCVELCCKEQKSPGVYCRNTCHPVGTIECKGSCVDSTTNSNCGSCGNACDEAMGEQCLDGECRQPSCEELGADCFGCVARPDCGFCRSKGGATDECRAGDGSGPTDGSSCPGDWPANIKDGGWIRVRGNCPN